MEKDYNLKVKDGKAKDELIFFDPMG